MLNTSYAHLNTVQKGSFGEAFSKMAFTLEGFEVYTTEYDDRGVDFIVRNGAGTFFSVQVKTTGATVNPCVYHDKFQKSPDFLVCAVRLIEGEFPRLYLASGSDWVPGDDCLHFNPGGGNTGAYYEMRFSKIYQESLQRHQFENYVKLLKK